MSTVTTQPEAFVEFLPAQTGHNLRHHAGAGLHVTGEDCGCQPERIPHKRKPLLNNGRKATARRKARK